MPHLRALALFLVLAASSGCGIKGPPRPPVEAVDSSSVFQPVADAGCCREPR